MTKTTYLLSLAAASILSVSASAAEPCKFYLKADGGYALHNNTKEVAQYYEKGAVVSSEDPLLKEGRGFVGSVGAGYGFNESLRTEVTFDYNPKKGSTHSFDYESREFGGTVKLVHDFNTSGNVVPFVYGSVGAVNARVTVKPSVKNADKYGKHIAAVDADGKLVQSNGVVTLLESSKQDSKTAMKLGAGFGVSYKFADNMNLDVTYGVSGRAKYKLLQNLATVNVDSTIGSASSATAASNIDLNKSVLYKNVEFKQQMDQSLSLGLRFTL